MPFPITEGLDAVWGYRPSPADMRRLLDIFAYSRELVTDELAEVATWPASSPASRRRSARCSPPHGSAGWTPWPRPTTTSGIPHPTLLVHGT